MILTEDCRLPVLMFFSCDFHDEICWYVTIIVLCEGFNGWDAILKCGDEAVVREDGMGG